jgi:hypothetical protein
MHLAHYPIGGFTFDQISRPLVMPDGSPLRVGATWREREANGNIKDEWILFIINNLGWRSLQVYPSTVDIAELSSSGNYIFPNPFSPELYNMWTGNMSITGVSTAATAPGNLNPIDSAQNYYQFFAYTLIERNIGSFVGLASLQNKTNAANSNVEFNLSLPSFINIPNNVHNGLVPRGVVLQLTKVSSPANLEEVGISMEFRKGRKNV